MLVLGVDGVPCSLLERYAAERVMPNLARMLEEGELHRMDTALPEVSSVAWSTFITGANPGRHGVFGFTELEPSSYRVRFSSFASIRVPTTWDTLGREGRTSIIVNVPHTCPARPLRGVLVSGFVATDLARATYPRVLLPRLREMGYRPDVDVALARAGRMDAFLDDSFDTLKRRHRTFDFLWSHQPWDYFVATITGTDRLNHFLWEAENDPDHRYHERFRAFYREVDRVMGDLYGRLEARDTCFIISDHGFAGITQEVYLNRWLEEQGYLELDGDGHLLDQMHSESKAFALDPSRIYIHTMERFPRGSVRPGREYLELREEISQKLLAMRYQAAGEERPVIRQVLSREELYSGPCLAQAPDIVALSHPGFDLKGAGGKKEVFGRTLLTGMHTSAETAMFVNRCNIVARRPHIMDISPTVLDLLEVPIPPGTDGRTLLKT